MILLFVQIAMRYTGPRGKPLSPFELQKAQALAALGVVGLIILALLVALGIFIARKRKVAKEPEISADTARAIANALRAYEAQTAPSSTR